MFKIIDNTIILTRGDSMSAPLTMKNPDGTTYQPQTGDEIVFSMKKYYTDDIALLTKEIDIDEPALIIDQDDTEDLPFGWYVYDIKLTTAGGDVDTFIAKGSFKVDEEAH